MHVVEGQHHGRGGGGALGEELDHRPEETVAARRRAVLPGELGQKGPEVGGQGGAHRARRELAEGIDPRAERPARLGLERPSSEHGAAAGAGGLAQLGEEARLAEARLARQQQRPRAALPVRALERPDELSPLVLAADETGGDGRGGRSRGLGLPRRRDHGRLPRASPRRLQLPRARPAELLQQAKGGLVLLLGLAPAAGGREQPDEVRSRRLVERVDGGQRPRVGQRRLGIAVQARDEGAQERRVELARLLALGHAPGLEVEEVAEVEPLEELPAELAREREELRERRTVEPGGAALLQGEDVDPGALCGEGHAVARGEDPRKVGLVHDRPEPAQAPPQGAAWVVGHVPEQSAEPLAAVGPVAQGQVRQQAARLLGGGQVETLPGPEDLHLPQEAKLEGFHCRHLPPREITLSRDVSS